LPRSRFSSSSGRRGCGGRAVLGFASARRRGFAGKQVEVIVGSAVGGGTVNPR